MTLQQERSYKFRIQEAREAEKEWDRHNENGDFDDMDDDVWREMMSEKTHAVYLAKMAYADAKIKAIRPNDWYKSFLSSFGTPPDDPEKQLLKSVSPKQASILMEKGEYVREAEAYRFRYDGNVYTLEKPKYGGYSLTIRKQFL